MPDLYLNHFSAKGVPEFWLTAMKTNEVLSEEVNIETSFLCCFLLIHCSMMVSIFLLNLQIQERDEAALKYLKDIKWSRIEDPKGFKLDFFFDTNPFIKNSVLTKTYMVDEDDLILEKAIGLVFCIHFVLYRFLLLCSVSLHVCAWLTSTLCLQN
jgi:nucleosome assembly protein 1-like 1